MEETFKPSSLSIRKLFGNADALYKIPQYQRPYKWEDEQVGKLWSDIHDAFENQEENYFLGSIITAKPRDDEKSAYVDVVDGQQRLTTLMILFCVIRDMFPNLNVNNSDETELPVDSDTIRASISLHGKLNRLKLYTHRQHQSDFDTIILTGNTSVIKKPYKYQVRMDEEPKFKFANTAAIFADKFSQLSSSESEAFIEYIFNQVYVIRIDCLNRGFAIKLFQVLNDRGMDLTAADLIKSFLLERLYSTHRNDPDTSKLKEEQFIADWREIEQIIKTCDIDMNDLFILYQYYIMAQNPKKSLYDELQVAFQNSDPNLVIGDIKKFARNYYTNIFEARDRCIYSLWYIRWNMHWKSILLTALHTEYKSFNELTKLLRRFYYLYWIAGKTLSDVKHASFAIIKSLKDQESIEKITKDIEVKLKNDNIEALSLGALMSENIASSHWCKPLLLLAEYNASDDSKLSFIDLNQDLHLEHILPVKYSKFKEWSHINGEIAKKWINSAGNLTLLSGAKNIEASNNPFDIKMGVYKGKGKYDDKNAKITAFLITQQIVYDYEQSTYAQQWTISAIVNRWGWFFSEVGELLDIDVGDALEKHEPILN